MPAELRVTPDRDRRLAEQAQALAETDAVRLLDLVAAALEATANGAQARIQLELVLVKAAAPEMDPSMAALLARIERLGAGAAPGARPPPGSRRAPTACAEAAVRAPADGPRTPPARPPSPRLPVSPPSRRASAQACHAARRRHPAPPRTRARTLRRLLAGGRRPRPPDNAMLAAALDAPVRSPSTSAALTLAFPAGAAFLKRKAEQDDYRRAAAEASAR